MKTTQNNRTEAYVRQAGSLSFTRVLDAGHLVPFYQPETAHDIFNRASQGLDVATGTEPVVSWASSMDPKQIAKEDGEDKGKDGESEGYSTSGSKSIWHIKNIPPPQAPEWCNPNWAPLNFVCSESQIQALADGTAVVVDGVVVKPSQEPRR